MKFMSFQYRTIFKKLAGIIRSLKHIKAVCSGTANCCASVLYVTIESKYMFHDSGWQDLTLETGHESTICSDLSTFPARKFKSVKADELIRSKTSSCFPEVTGEQYERLKDDIQRNGQLNPILVHGNEVVDGWTRCRICGELGLKAMVLEISDQNEIRATLSSQFNRGHFSQLQKAAIIRDAVDARGRGRPKKSQNLTIFSMN